MKKSAVLDSNRFRLEMSAKIYKNDPTVNNSILNVIVHSDGFAGTVEMDVGADDINQFVKQIHTMNKKLKGSAQLKEAYGDCYIHMEMDKTGHIDVHGYLHSLYNTLRFENKFDLFYLDMFDKALADTQNWQEIIYE